MSKSIKIIRSINLKILFWVSVILYLSLTIAYGQQSIPVQIKINTLPNEKGISTGYIQDSTVLEIKNLNGLLLTSLSQNKKDYSLKFLPLKKDGITTYKDKEGQIIFAGKTQVKNFKVGSSLDLTIDKKRLENLIALIDSKDSNDNKKFSTQNSKISGSNNANAETEQALQLILSNASGSLDNENPAEDNIITTQKISDAINSASDQDLETIIEYVNQIIDGTIVNPNISPEEAEELLKEIDKKLAETEDDQDTETNSDSNAVNNPNNDVNTDNPYDSDDDVNTDNPYDSDIDSNTDNPYGSTDNNADNPYAKDRDLDSTINDIIGDIAAITPIEEAETTETVACSPIIQKNKYLTRANKITYRGTKIKSETGCKTTNTKNVLRDYEACKLIHSFSQKTSYEAYKNYYNDSLQGQTNVSDCIKDSKKTYPHSRTAHGCDFDVDETTKEIIQKFKTKIVVDGAIQYISECVPLENYRTAITTFTRNYDVCEPTVNLENNYATLWYQEETRVGLKTYSIGGCKPSSDEKDQIDLYYTDKDCGFEHWTLEGYSKSKERRAYSNKGSETFVESCSAKEGLAYTYYHKTDNKYCPPQVVNYKAYEAERTYFIDGKGFVRYVSPCAVTETDFQAEASDIEKDYSACNVKIDFDANKVFPYYRDILIIGDQNQELSSCKFDPNEAYTIERNYDNCDKFIDYEREVAHEGFQKVYHDGQREIPISACAKDEDIYDNLSKDYDICKAELNPEKSKIFSYFSYYYKTGDVRTHVGGCKLSDRFTTITDDIIIKKYDTCAVYPNYEEGYALATYKKYISLNGKEVQISNCLPDLNTKYFLTEDTNTCLNNYRPSFDERKIYTTSRWLIDKGSGNEAYSGCKENGRTRDIVITSIGCKKQIVGDRYYSTQSSYFIDETGTQISIQGCSLSDQYVQGNWKICDDRFAHSWSGNYSAYNVKLVNSDGANITDCEPSKNLATLSHVTEQCSTDLSLAPEKYKIYLSRYVEETQGENKGKLIQISSCGEQREDYLLLDPALVEANIFYNFSSARFTETEESQDYSLRTRNPSITTLKNHYRLNNNIIAADSNGENRQEITYQFSHYGSGTKICNGGKSVTHDRWGTPSWTCNWYDWNSWVTATKTTKTYHKVLSASTYSYIDHEGKKKFFYLEINEPYESVQNYNKDFPIPPHNYDNLIVKGTHDRYADQ